MLITTFVNLSLFLLGFLFRVLLYSYRVIFDPKKVLNTMITKSSFNKWYFVIHLYLTSIGTTVGLYACIASESWLAFFILDGIVWLMSLIMLFTGINQIPVNYGSKVGTFTTLRNVVEIIIHALIGYLTFYNIIDTWFWLRLIVFGLWPNRVIDTYPKFYVFRKHELFNLAHIIITYTTQISLALLYLSGWSLSTMIGGIVIDAITIVYLGMTVLFIYQYQWNTDNWRDLGPLLAIYRILQRANLQKNNIHRVPKNLDPELFKVYHEEKCQYKKWGIDRTKFRTITGYAADQENKLNGAIGQYIGKNITVDNVVDQYEFKITERELTDREKLFVPSTVGVSKDLFVRDDSPNGYYEKTQQTLREQLDQGDVHLPNALFSYWVQMMIDDWVRIRTFSDDTHDLMHLPKPSHLPITKIGERKDTTYVLSDDMVPPLIQDDIRYYRNEKAHWWNSGIIYGCTLERYKEIRDPPCHKNGHKKGQIKVNENYLALDPQGHEITGVTVNMNSARGAIQYTFAKFHNAVASMMEKTYPMMSDEEIRQTVRLIVSASIAKIHTLEWTCAFLNDPTAEYTQYTFIDGLLGESIIKLLTGGSRFQNKPRFQNNLWTGIMGGTVDKTSSFAHTLEFQTIYKLHYLVPSKIHVRSAETGKEIDLGIIDQSFVRSPDIFVKAGVKMHDFIKAMGHTIAGTLNPFNVPKEMMHIPMRSKTQPCYENMYMDILASTFWRDRDRGVYRYNAFRKGLGLSTFDNVDDFIADCKTYGNQYIIDYESQIRDALKVHYNNDMEALDLMVGCALEKKYPGFQIPDTIYTIFTFQTQRRMEQDPFFTDKFNKDHYTEFGMRILDDITMARVLKTVYPELKTQLADDDNVFMVWGKNNKKVVIPSIFDAFFPMS